MNASTCTGLLSRPQAGWRAAFVALCTIAGLWQCGDNQEQKLQFSLQRSLMNYWKSLDGLHEEGLKTYAYFPDVKDYRGYVSKLRLEYLEQAQTERTVSFDPQGVVLSRFLGLLYHRYEVEALEVAESGVSARMRIAVRFSYDANIEHSQYEDGTKVFVPGQPLGKVHIIVVGEENEIPREELAYLEIEIEFRKTNFEDFWQVRSMKPLAETARFETSYKDVF